MRNLAHPTIDPTVDRYIALIRRLHVALSTGGLLEKNAHIMTCCSFTPIQFEHNTKADRFVGHVEKSQGDPDDNHAYGTEDLKDKATYIDPPQLHWWP